MNLVILCHKCFRSGACAEEFCVWESRADSVEFRTDQEQLGPGFNCLTHAARTLNNVTIFAKKQQVWRTFGDYWSCSLLKVLSLDVFCSGSYDNIWLKLKCNFVLFRFWNRSWRTWRLFLCCEFVLLQIIIGSIIYSDWNLKTMHGILIFVAILSGVNAKGDVFVWF